MSIEPGEKIQTVHKSKTSQIVFQTIFHCRVRLGEADLHHCFPVRITIGISDLLDELPQPVLSRCRRIKPDAASLNVSWKYSGQKDMAEHLVKTLCHIVFILKLYSKFLLGLFHCPAYLQLAPLPEELCSSGNAADYQWSIGIMGLSPLRGSLRAAHSKKRRKYHYTRHLHRRKQPHHTTVIALRRSLTPFREVLASEAVLLRRSGKIRSTELFSFQGTVKWSD